MPQWWAQLPELTFPQKSKLMGHQRLNPGVHFEQRNLLQNISSELWTLPYPSKKGCQLDAQPSSTDLPLPQEAQAALISHLRNHYLLMPHFHIYQHIPIALSTIYKSSSAIRLQLRSDLFPATPQQHVSDNCLFFTSSEKKSQRHVPLKSLRRICSYPVISVFSPTTVLVWPFNCFIVLGPFGFWCNSTD